ncbi:MAG: hypothetical protein ACXV8Q_00310 [Methylobacter sp.]
MAQTDRIPALVRQILSEHKENPPTGYRRYFYLVEIIADIDRLLQFGNVTAKELAELAGENYGAFRKQLVKARAMTTKMAEAGVMPPIAARKTETKKQEDKKDDGETAETPEKIETEAKTISNPTDVRNALKQGVDMSIYTKQKKETK